MSTGYTVEYKKGDVSLVQSNVLLADEADMHLVEYWEDRLTRFGQDYTVAFRTVSGRIVYSIFTDMRDSGSAFKS